MRAVEQIAGNLLWLCWQLHPTPALLLVASVEASVSAAPVALDLKKQKGFGCNQLISRLAHLVPSDFCGAFTIAVGEHTP